MTMWEKLCAEAMQKHDAQNYSSVENALGAATAIAQELTATLTVDQLLDILETRPDFLTTYSWRINDQYGSLKEIDCLREHFTPQLFLQCVICDTLEKMVEERLGIEYEEEA